MKRYSDDWCCPKCGHGGWPEWKRECVVTTDGPMHHLEGPLIERCTWCGYEEEVAPLDTCPNCLSTTYTSLGVWDSATREMRCDQCWGKR